LQPVTVSTTIDRPREEVFAYLADIANHPEFTDHFLSDWRLTRVDPVGRGAGARFHVDAPRRRFSWADTTFVEVSAPHRIVALGRGGKFNRVKTFTEWRLEPAGGGGTRVELTMESETTMLSDKLFDPLGSRRWWRRKARKALRRMQAILEDDPATARVPTGRRATVAGL
jgi:uncharacterized protein YndB with AHSA1/START domain